MREALWVTLFLFSVILVGCSMAPQSNSFDVIDLEQLDSTYLAYLWVAPLQEITARGIIQIQIARRIKQQGAEYIAIVLTAVPFAVLHLFHSIPFAAASLIFSILCGVMFMRKRNIISVSVLHIMVGNFAGITGAWDQLATSTW